jgi:hypothetical protein
MMKAMGEVALASRFRTELVKAGKTDAKSTAKIGTLFLLLFRPKVSTGSRERCYSSADQSREPDQQGLLYTPLPSKPEVDSGGEGRK